MVTTHKEAQPIDPTPGGASLHRRRRPRRSLPGFGLSMGYTLAYLSIIVLIPLSAVFIRAAGMGAGDLWLAVTEPRVLAALRVSFGASLIAALVNMVGGTIVAWVLVRYRFPGRRVIDAMIDLPFALPTAVAGIALTAIYAPNGMFGKPLSLLGVKVAFALPGIVIALIFIGLPFVVRTVQPVLENLESELEEAAATLGATRLQTIRRVVLPALYPSVITGSTLAFARAVGEYGSVIFIAGNMPLKTEIAPLLIVTKLEQYDYAGATAVAVVMLLISLVILLLVNVLQRWSSIRTGAS